MTRIARIVLAVLAGAVVGSLVNMGLVNIGPFVVPLPEGAALLSSARLRTSESM